MFIYGRDYLSRNRIKHMIEKVGGLAIDEQEIYKKLVVG